MRRPRPLSLTALTVLYFLTQTVFPHAAETGFWAQRAESARRFRSGDSAPRLSLSGLPLETPRVGALPPGNASSDWARGLARHAVVRERASGPGPTVIHIQDVHGHADAQRNIAAVLERLLEQYPGTAVLLEGAAGPIELTAFRPTQDPQNRAAAGFFFRSGLLTGAEAAVLGAAAAPALAGAEDPNQYIENRRAVDAARAARPSWEKRLAQWRAALESAKKNVYSPRLQALDQRAARWRTDGGFLDRASFLGETTDLPAPDPEGALGRFVRLMEIEKRLSTEAAARERSVFLEALSDRLTVSEVKSVAADALALRSGDLSPGAFYSGLAALAARRGVSLKQHPAFDAFVQYAALAESVRPEALEEELNARESRLWSSMVHSSDERNVRALDEVLGDWERLTDLSFTPADWRAYLVRSRDRSGWADRWSALGVADVSFAGLEAFEDFYRYAESRNKALADNAWAAAQRSGRAVLVAGGFHNAGVEALLSARGAHFVTVSPKLGDGMAHVQGPFDLFFRDHTPLEQLFQSPRVSLAETSGLAPLTPDGWPRARAVRRLAPVVRAALSAPGEPQSVSSFDGGVDIAVASSPEETPPTPAGARRVIADVPASIENQSDAPRVSIYHRQGAWLSTAWGRLKNFSRAGQKARSKLLGVALLTALWLPLAAVTSAHAYTLVEGPAGVHVMVEKGEHLWGAATAVLKAEGTPKPANAQIAAKVKEMATLNGLNHPDLIHPKTLYMATPAPATADAPTVPELPTGPTAENPTDVSVEAASSELGNPATAVAPLPARGDPPTLAPSPGGMSPGFVTALVAAILVVAAWAQRAYSPRRAVRAVSGAWTRARSSVGAGLEALGAATKTGFGQRADPWTRTLVLGFMAATVVAVVPGVGHWSAVDASWIDPGAFINHLRDFLITQWPVLLALSTGLLGAVYYVWFRAKEVDLSAIEKNEPRVRDWIALLDRVEKEDTMSEEDLSWLANNVHALILNHRVTPAAVADRGHMEKRIDAYRAIARLSERTVRFLDRRLESETLKTGNTRDRWVDTREKFFLYQLYGLKTAHALVPASVAHWALSNYDRRDSWFEKRKLGAVLRFVRGVRPMIRQTVGEYRERLLTDDPRPGRTLWERAEGLSVVSLGNILVPGLYDDGDRADLARVFDTLQIKSETKELSDMSAKDLHRKGWGTMISLLIWSVAISRMVSVFPAMMAFLTGLGVTMALFRIQTLGTRRDGFFRTALKTWREMNQRPHANGRMKGNGETAGEDPFHLNRDFARFHFQEAENALREELNASTPATDVVLLIAQTEEEKAYFESRAADRSLFPAGVPVVVLTVPARRGSFAAYARAWTYLHSDEFKALGEQHPHLKGRAPWTVNAATLVAKGNAVEGMSRRLSELPLFAGRLGVAALGQLTIFDLAVMNAYRATRARAEGGARGGVALRWADRAYVGPVRVSAGPGVTLDTQWVNREDMDRFNFGAVIASLDKPIKLIRRSRVEKTLGLLAEEHTNRVYDLGNDRLKQIQAFSGEGFFAFDAESAAAHHAFLKDVTARADALPAAADLDPPSLNLMTYYLVPLCIAQSEDAEVNHKINVYFSGHGFLSDPLPEAIQRFNNRSANALAAAFQGSARPSFALNAAFVDESLYASADAAVEQDEADFEPGVPVPDAPRWRDLLRRAVRNGAVNVFVFLGVFFPVLAAAGPKSVPVESVLNGPVPYVAAVAGATLPPRASWGRGGKYLLSFASSPRVWGMAGVSAALLLVSGNVLPGDVLGAFTGSLGAGGAVATAFGAGLLAMAVAAHFVRGGSAPLWLSRRGEETVSPEQEKRSDSPAGIPAAPDGKVTHGEEGGTPATSTGAAPSMISFARRAGHAVLNRLAGGKALWGVKIALLPVALFVNYGGLVQAFGSAGVLVFAPALLLIPAFFLTVFELFVDDLIAWRLGSAPSADAVVARGRSSRTFARSTPTVDVTAEAWAHPEETVAGLVDLLTALHASPHRNTAAEREVARLLVRASAEAPLPVDLSRRLSLSGLRGAVAQAEETRVRLFARRSADPRGERRARIDDVVELSLAHQIAWAWKTHRRGAAPRAEFRQAWLLRGMMGRSLPENPRADALLGALGLFLGVEGAGGATDWSKGARKLAVLLEGARAVPVEDLDAQLTAIRVTEFLPGAGDGAARRPVLEKHLVDRAKRFRPGADAGDVLIVNGRGADEERIKNILRKRVAGIPAFDAYLAACRVVVLPEERFAPEAVLAALPDTATRGRTIDFFTADPAAILVNPRRSHLSYRVLLLDLVGGALTAVDLLDLARRALKAARVVATSA